MKKNDACFCTRHLDTGVVVDVQFDEEGKNANLDVNLDFAKNCQNCAADEVKPLPYNHAPIMTGSFVEKVRSWEYRGKRYMEVSYFEYRDDGNFSKMRHRFRRCNGEIIYYV